MEQRDTPSAAPIDLAIGPIIDTRAQAARVAGLYVGWTQSDAPQQQAQLFTALKALDQGQVYALNVQGEAVTLTWTGDPAVPEFGGRWILATGDNTILAMNHNETLVHDGD